MIPEAVANPAPEEIKRLLETARSVAVVGLSPKPERDSYQVAKYLLEHGYRVIPVNPVVEEVLGQKSYPDLGSLPEPVDIVDVFRRSEFVPPIAEQAVALGAKALWLQLGVRHDQAAALARDKGLLVVQDLCIKVMHHKLLG